MMADPDIYYIGWICGVEIEYIAAMCFLDEEHPGPRSLSPHDQNAYTLGRMGEHNVVITSLPTGDLGLVSAAATATQLRLSFPNIKVVLSVEIATGIPSPSHDIRLGDIVVGMPRNGNSGVLQFDTGTILQDHDFMPKERYLHAPPITLMAAFGALMSEYSRHGHGLEHAINRATAMSPTLQKKFSKPHKQTDTLFLADYPHIGNENCEFCDPSFLKGRDERSTHTNDPEIHHGLIASGNALIKDSRFRDRLSVEKDVLCFDMTAAGIVNCVPCLAIRGIYGYSDTHRTNAWQGYAAITSAAFANDLLRCINPQAVGVKTTMLNTPFNGSEVSMTSDPGFLSDTKVSPSAKDMIASQGSNQIRAILPNAASPSAVGKMSIVVGQQSFENDDENSVQSKSDTRGVKVGFDSATIQSVNDASTAQVSADTWFKNNMSQVEKFFSQIRREPIDAKENIPQARIAVLDTGIDLTHPKLKKFLQKNRISGGYCRDFVEPGKSPITDNSGHGTHCAHLILKICSTAKLFIARVFNTDQGDAGTAERVALAIEWAVTNEVDIIVMAFAFSSFQPRIYQAIRNAQCPRNVLVFAAASNNKHDDSNPVGFPARIQEVIRVNSCTSKGHASTFSPGCSELRHNLATIGEEINAAFMETVLDNNNRESQKTIMKRLSGTSEATAIMAGISGLVLEFARTKTVTGPNVVSLDRLLMNEEMINILQQCMGGGEPLTPSKYCYIKPWVIFNPDIPRDHAVWRIKILFQEYK